MHFYLETYFPVDTTSTVLPKTCRADHTPAEREYVIVTLSQRMLRYLQRMRPKNWSPREPYQWRAKAVTPDV
jgi:hypothetical protein